MDFFGSVKKFFGLEEGPHFSRAEIARHNTRESLWIVADGKVYDVTQFLDQHAGGAQSILKRGGGVHDCSRDFGFHSSKAQTLWKTFQIGFVATEGKTDEEGRNYLRSRGFVPVEDIVARKGNASFSSNSNNVNINNNIVNSSSNNNVAECSGDGILKCAGKSCAFHFEGDAGARSSSTDVKTVNGGATSDKNNKVSSNAGKAPSY